MRKKVGIVKRMSCLLLIFLLSINSFAAIVSDNDGSAFITKAEFDALKSSFQAQIDTYNSSIDNKIDGAIAQYLSGIRITNSETKSILISEEKSVGYFDDVNYKYKYGRPEISLDGSYVNANFSASSQSSGERYVNTSKLHWVTKPSPSEGFVGSLKNYSINDSTHKITVNSLKLDGFYKQIRYSITANGDGKMPQCDGYPGWNTLNYYIGINTSSLAYSSNTWSDSSLWTGQSYVASTWYGDHNGTINNPFVSSFNLAANALEDKQEMYFIAYDGSISKLLINANTLPFTYLGGADVASSDATETVKTMNSDSTTTCTGLELSLWKGNGSASSDTGYINASKRTAPTTKVGVIGGIGYFDGHTILQAQEEINSAGITASNISLAAGFPLLVAKKETQIKWIPKFIDNTKTYRIWLSYEPFDSKSYSTYHGKPFSGLDYVDIKEKVPGQNYVQFTGGSGTISFTMAKDSVVYLKWSQVVSSTDTAAGILDLANCNTYESIKGS